MPTYEYACKSCGEHLEVVQSFRDEPMTLCPACGGQLRKVFGSIGIAFKGSGFYKTDSRSGGHSTGKSSGSGGAAGESKTGESKTGESKTGESKTGESKSASSSDSSASAPAAAAG